MTNALPVFEGRMFVPRLAWVERKRKRDHRSKISYALLNHAWRGSNDGVDCYVVVMGRPRMPP